MLRIMQAVKAVVIILICLGLVVPSAHGLALCVGCDGSVALEIAIDGACAGARSAACCGRAPCGEDALQHRLVVEAHAVHDGCRDTLLGRDAAHPPNTLSAKRLVPRPGSDGEVAAESTTAPVVRQGTATRGTGPERGSSPPSFLGITVLIL